MESGGAAMAFPFMLCFDYYRLIKSFFTQKTCKYGLF